MDVPTSVKCHSQPLFDYRIGAVDGLMTDGGTFSPSVRVLSILMTSSYVFGAGHANYWLCAPVRGNHYRHKAKLFSVNCPLRWKRAEKCADGIGQQFCRPQACYYLADALSGRRCAAAIQPRPRYSTSYRSDRARSATCCPDTTSKLVCRCRRQRAQHVSANPCAAAATRCAARCRGREAAAARLASLRAGGVAAPRCMYRAELSSPCRRPTDIPDFHGRARP